jgi:hypothetical protein
MVQQPKRKPLGAPIDWSDDTDIDTLARVSDADIKAAQALWDAEAPKPYKGLLQAQVEEEQ